MPSVRRALMLIRQELQRVVDKCVTRALARLAAHRTVAAPSMHSGRLAHRRGCTVCRRDVAYAADRHRIQRDPRTES